MSANRKSSANRAASVALPLACALWLLGCGGDDGGDAVAPVGSGRRDAGRVQDASAAPMAKDSGPRDTEIHAGEHYLCGYDDEDALTLPGSAEHPEVAIAATETGFALVFHDARGSLFIVADPVAGAADAPVRIVASEQAPRSAAIAAGEEGFLLAFRSGAAGELLRVRALRAAEDPALDLDRDVVQSASGGELTALIGVPEGFAAAWLAQTAAGPELRVQRLDSRGAAVGEPRAIAGVGARDPQDLHLGRLDRGRMLLSWLEYDGAGDGQVVGMPLRADLEPEAEPLSLSRHAVTASRFDLSARGQHAGLIYEAKDGDVREAIKYRRIDRDGLATQAALNIVNAPGRALHGSIAPFGQGYAVAYRALPSLGVPSAVIRVAFINQFGDIVYEADIADTTATGGRTTIAATVAGHVLVGWTSEWPSGPATHALKLHCPGALVLCGG